QAFNMSSAYRIGNVVLKALDSLLALSKDYTNTEELLVVTESLESERVRIKKWDKNREGPLRQAVYDICESIETALHCIIDRK
ncbi:hypothetical protein PENTCL1PPCAC_20714, partial [Pristionchus entomophagus]